MYFLESLSLIYILDPVSASEFCSPPYHPAMIELSCRAQCVLSSVQHRCTVGLKVAYSETLHILELYANFGFMDRPALSPKGTAQKAHMLGGKRRTGGP